MVLCESINPVEEYNGRNIDTMPKLLVDGRIPMSTSQLMNYRINESDKFPDWKDLYFDTSDLVAYSSKEDGKLKFILTVDKDGKITDNGKRALDLINPNSKRSSGAIELGEQYNSLEGIKVAVGNLGKIRDYLSKDEILGNPVWRILARHPDEVPEELAEDKNLLKEYSSWVANQTGKDKNMRVYVDSLGKFSKLRAWYVDGLDYRSDALGWGDLDLGGGRFVGLVPEAHSLRIVKPTLEQSINILNENLEKVEIRTR